MNKNAKPEELRGALKAGVDKELYEQQTEKHHGGKYIPPDEMLQGNLVKSESGLLIAEDEPAFTDAQIQAAYMAFVDLPAVDSDTITLLPGHMLIQVFQLQSATQFVRNSRKQLEYMRKVYPIAKVLNSTTDMKDLSSIVPGQFIILHHSIGEYGKNPEHDNWVYRITNEKPTPSHLPEPLYYAGGINDLQDTYALPLSLEHNEFIGNVFTFVLPVNERHFVRGITTRKYLDSLFLKK